MALKKNDRRKLRELFDQGYEFEDACDELNLRASGDRADAQRYWDHLMYEEYR